MTRLGGRGGAATTAGKGKRKRPIQPRGVRTASHPGQNWTGRRDVTDAPRSTGALMRLIVCSSGGFDPGLTPVQTEIFWFEVLPPFELLPRSTAINGAALDSRFATPGVRTGSEKVDERRPHRHTFEARGPNARTSAARHGPPKGAAGADERAGGSAPRGAEEARRRRRRGLSGASRSSTAALDFRSAEGGRGVALARAPGAPAREPVAASGSRRRELARARRRGRLARSPAPAPRPTPTPPRAGEPRAFSDSKATLPSAHAPDSLASRRRAASARGSRSSSPPAARVARSV